MKRNIKLFAAMLIIFILSVPAFADVAINETNFPDANFRKYLKDTFTILVDGRLVAERESFADSELPDVKTISPENYGITDLTGIKLFPYLQTLNCYNNAITRLDVSGMTNLKILYCNVNRLAELNIAGCSALEELDCSGNNLTALNASGLTQLKILCCTNPDGASVKLASINVSGCSSLEELDCRGHGLSSLNVSGLSRLKILKCNNLKNAPSLTELILTGCTALAELDCQGNRLASLNASGLSSLKNLKANLNLLTSLNLTGCTALEELDCSGNKFSTLSINGLSRLKKLECTNNAEALSNFNVSGNPALEELDCRGSGIIAINLSGCSALKKIQCNVNSISALDLSGCTALEELDCSGNKLTTLDVSRCTRLVTLTSDINKLSSLNATGCTALKNLYIRSNNFTELNLTGNTALTTLECEAQSAPNALTVTRNGNDYIVNLNGIVAAQNFANVSGVKGYRNADEFDGVFNSSTGAITFTKQPKKLSYNYRTILANVFMDVTANVTLAGAETPQENTDTSVERGVITSGSVSNPVNNTTVATVVEDLVSQIDELYKDVKYTELSYGDKNYYPTYLKSSSDLANVVSLNRDAIKVDDSDKTTAALFTPINNNGTSIADDTVFFIWLMNPSSLGLKKSDGTSYEAWPTNAASLSAGYHVPFYMDNGSIQAYGPFLGVSKNGGVAFDITKLYYAADNSAGYKKNERGFIPALAVVFYFESAPAAEASSVNSVNSVNLAKFAKFTNFANFTPNIFNFKTAADETITFRSEVMGITASLTETQAEETADQNQNTEAPGDNTVSGGSSSGGGCNAGAAGFIFYFLLLMLVRAFKLKKFFNF